MPESYTGATIFVSLIFQFDIIIVIPEAEVPDPNFFYESLHQLLRLLLLILMVQTHFWPAVSVHSFLMAE